MAYQSLYRRYRSGTFGELVGQTHVVTALKNAIVEDRVGHAYLFSGPRGTGKTSTARILAKALNCTDLQPDGEPCTRCESCLSFASGTSYDLQELDAASNNGVDAIRELIARVALGSPGRTKVYILDEVHMLSTGAENALLKTLEEPPPHVVFVLATTEPHKVVATIRSRTQHFRFELLPADDLERHVRWVADDAGLAVDDAMVDYVLRVGGGSARDTLSALDQVVAAGGIPDGDDVIAAVLGHIASADSAGVIGAINQAAIAGRDPRVLGEALLGHLRDAFLTSMGAATPHLSDAQTAAAVAVASQMGPAAITRSLEVLGSSLIDMRQAPDPRIDLEVALLRLTRPDLDTDVAALTARIERLEQGAPVAASGAAVPAPAGAAPAPAPAASAPVADAAPPSAQPAPVADAAPPAPPPAGESAAAPAAGAGGSRPADAARAVLARGRGQAPEPEAPAPAAGEPRATLGSTRGTARPAPGAAPSGAEERPAQAPASSAAPASAAPAPAADDAGMAPSDAEMAAPSPSAPPPGASHDAGATPAPAPLGPGATPTVDQLAEAWEQLRPSLPGRAKSRFSGGRFVSADASSIVFGLPNAIHRDRCAECVGDVEAAFSAHLGVPVSFTLVVDGDPVPPSGLPPAPPPAAAEAEPEEAIDLTELIDASPDEAGGVELLTEAFPGAELIEE